MSLVTLEIAELRDVEDSLLGMVLAMEVRVRVSREHSLSAARRSGAPVPPAHDVALVVER